MATPNGISRNKKRRRMEVVVTRVCLSVFTGLGYGRRGETDLFRRLDEDDLGDVAEDLQLLDDLHLFRQKRHAHALRAARMQVANCWRELQVGVGRRPLEADAVGRRMVRDRQREGERFADVAIPEVHQV